MSDDFLSRWSRRKRERQPEETPEPAAAEPTAEEEAPGKEETDEEVLARLGLRHPDEMGRGDDFRTFLRAEVPKHLKTLAYRRLWRSNPTLACLDGLNDYDRDFTGTGVPDGGLKTAYQVGRGILGRIAEAEENRGTDVPEEPQQAETKDAGGPDRQDEGEPEVAPVPAHVPEIRPENDFPRAVRRRMVFRDTD